MNAERKIMSWVNMMFLCLFFSLNITLAEETKPQSAWTCFNLLDEDTKSSLIAQEKFFCGLFQLPGNYESASETEKKQLINQWIETLKGSNKEKITAAAAYLGMVKADNAARALEKLVRSPGGGGRVRWVCTRSLGQIGDKESIPVLIGLLNNQNREARVYARVSLAEITGVYLGGNPEKWKQWRPGNPEPRKESSDTIPSGIQRSFSTDRLDFCLSDTCGRLIDSRDYAKTPVLIMTGSCWCGGCQADAEPLRKIAEEYASKGLYTIRSVAGDNELAAMDFQKHYRLPFVHMLDPNRSFEKRYNSDGWTFLMLSDPNGKIIYKVNHPEEKDWAELKGILDKLVASPTANKPILRDGISYPLPTLQRSNEMTKPRLNERFPSIACGENGRRYVVFTTSKNDSNDVMLRVFENSNNPTDIPIAATAADEYDGTAVVDNQGRLWVSWTSNAAGKYDVYLLSLDSPARRGTPMRVTHSEDDAMHPRIACDKKGRIWVTYYKWRKMGNLSRDKEVYIKKFEHGKWSEELQVSPTDVPEHEDHTNPAVLADIYGALVTWSWDFHPPNKGYSAQAEAPTIFIRAVTPAMTLGRIACVSGKQIDMNPTLAAYKYQHAWCAWDSIDGNRQKSLCVSRVTPNHDNPVGGITSLSTAANICSPCLAAGTWGAVTAIWSDTENHTRWILKRADYDLRHNQWSTPCPVETNGNPRYPSATYDPGNNLWIAYSQETEEGRKITLMSSAPPSTVKDNPDRKVPSSDRNPGPNPTETLRRLIDEKYSYRDLRNVDWDNAFKLYEPRLKNARTPREFAEIAARMLVKAKDMHLWVKINEESIPVFKRTYKPNYDMAILEKTIPGWRKVSPYVFTGRFPNGIGYILITSWMRYDGQVLEPAINAIRELSNNPALIIDVRPNGGGAEPLAQKVAGCFIDRPVAYAKHVYRDSSTPSGWGPVRERTLNPNSDLPTYRGKIAVLMGQGNLSSCESFLLMMKQVPACTLIGEKSYGSSGNPKPYDLGNGVTLWLPSWKDLRPDGSCFEGKGIEPDIKVKYTEKSQDKDPVLEAALLFLKKTLPR